MPMKSIVSPLNLLFSLLILLAFLSGLYLRAVPQGKSEHNNSRTWSASELTSTDTVKTDKQALNAQRWQSDKNQTTASVPDKADISYQLLAVIQQGEQLTALLKQSAQKKIYRITQGDALEEDFIVQAISKNSVTLQSYHDTETQSQILRLYKTVDAP